MRHAGQVRRSAAFAAAVLSLGLGTLTACGSGSAEAGSTGGGSAVLRVGELGTAKYDEALLKASGQDQGMNYSIEWSLFPSGGGGFYEAVPSGSVDLALMADTPPIFGQVAGVKAHILGVETSLPKGESTVEIFAKPDSPINSVADLKGKKVALTEGTIMQYTVLKALEKAGLSYKDITPVNLSPADAMTAFQSGDVDAIAALTTQLAQLTAEGDKVVGDGVGTTSGYQVAAVADSAIDDPATLANVTDYLQRIGRAQEWAQTHQDEWIPQYAAVLGIPEDIAKILVERTEQHWIPIDDSVIASQQAEADAYTELGLIPEKLDVSQEFDDRLNDTLVKD